MQLRNPSFQKAYIESKTEQEIKIQMGSVAAILVLAPCSRFLKRDVEIPLPLSVDYSNLHLKWLATQA